MRGRTALALTGLAGLGLAAARTTRAYAAAVAADPRTASFARLTPRATPRVTAHDGVVLHLDEHGPERGPTVVLLHGWTCAAPFWDPVVRELAADHRVLALDLRGHGRSVADPATLSVSSLGRDVQAVLEQAVPDGERVVVVGHSMGGMAVAAWAGLHPQEVRRQAAAAVLLSTGFDRLGAEADFLPLPGRLAPVQRALQTRLMGLAGPLVGPRAVGRAIQRRIALGPHAPAAAADHGAALMMATPSRTRVGWARVMERLDLLDAAAALDVPAVVVVGEADRLTPPPMSERVAAALPRLEEHLVLPGVGHMTPYEVPETVAALVRRATGTAPLRSTA